MFLIILQIIQQVRQDESASKLVRCDFNGHYSFQMELLLVKNIGQYWEILDNIGNFSIIWDNICQYCSIGIPKNISNHLTFKGTMHHKHDVSLKDAFYIIDLAAGFFLLKILNHRQRGTFCPLTLPSHQPHFSFSSASDYLLPDEMVN